MKDKITSYTEYAVEINNDNGFREQVDVFETYEEAEECIKDFDKSSISDDEYLNIIFIDYDVYGNEIRFGSVV